MQREQESVPRSRRRLPGSNKTLGRHARGSSRLQDHASPDWINRGVGDEMTEKNSTSVLIVGGGPVGLALALELGMRGIETVVVEQRDGKVALPKMNTV